MHHRAKGFGEDHLIRSNISFAIQGEISDYTRSQYYHIVAEYAYLGTRDNPNVLTWLLGRKPTTSEEYIRNIYQEIQNKK